MKKELISNKQIYSINILYIIVYSLVFGTGYSAKNDSWIAILISIALAVPLVLIHTKILECYPGKNLFEIFEIVLGKILGKILILAYVIYIIYLCGLVTAAVINFIKIVGIFATPKFISLAFLIGLSIYALKIGIEVIGRYSEFCVIIIFFLTIIVVILLIPKMHLKNITPILYNGYKPVLDSVIKNISYPFGEFIILCCLADSFKDTKSISKVFIYSLLVAGGIILILAVLSITVLGNEYLAKSYFPSYEVVRRIKVGDSIQRIEIMITVMFLICEFLKITVIILSACKGIQKLFNLKDYRVVVIPSAIIMINLSYVIYSSLMKGLEFINTIWVCYGLVFQIIIPFIIFLIIKIKKVFKNST